jgi:hypothetical protein
LDDVDDEFADMEVCLANVEGTSYISSLNPPRLRNFRPHSVFMPLKEFESLVLQIMNNEADWLRVPPSYADVDPIEHGFTQHLGMDIYANAILYGPWSFGVFDRHHFTRKSICGHVVPDSLK